MALLDRIFGSKKTAAVPAADRVDQVIAPEKDTPRPARAMVYREVTVMYESGYTRKGVVLDYSDHGVRLRFSTVERLPDEVRLKADAVGLHGAARVVWQEGSEVGLTMI
ncbi:MAG: PilZ domain-containing protein [Hyphomonas sp.]